MAQWLRVLGALPEGLCLTPSNHTLAHNNLKLQFQRIQSPLLALWALCVKMHRQTCRQNTHKHMKQKLKKQQQNKLTCRLEKDSPGMTSICCYCRGPVYFAGPMPNDLQPPIILIPEIHAPSVFSGLCIPLSLAYFLTLSFI